MPEIKPDKIYTTSEAQDFLRISKSTIKRLLKKGIIRAYKVGGQYRIWGDEILSLVSPKLERKVYRVYSKIRDKARRKLGQWS